MNTIYCGDSRLGAHYDWVLLRFATLTPVQPIRLFLHAVYDAFGIFHYNRRLGSVHRFGLECYFEVD